MELPILMLGVDLMMVWYNKMQRRNPSISSFPHVLPHCSAPALQHCLVSIMPIHSVLRFGSCITNKGNPFITRLESVFRDAGKWTA